MAGRDVGRTRIDKLTIHLVREEVEVVLLHEVTYLIHLTTCIKVSRRVIGITYHDGLGALVDEFLKTLYLRQAESLLDSGRYSTYHSTCRDSKRLIVGIEGVGHDNLIARIETSHEREEHCLATTRSNDDIVSCELDVVLGIILHQLLAIAAIALRGAILQHLTIYIADCINSCLRSGKVGLTDIEVIYMYTACLGIIGQRHQFADRRSGHQCATLRYLGHIYYI